jgi:co-chaperonin GroES (HSP10)
MKKEIMPLFNNVILRPYSENPYVETVTKTGLIYNDGDFDNSDSGEHEQMDLQIKCAEVVEVGPECKYTKVGDDVYFNVFSARPVPFQRQGFILCNELNILSIMNDNLDERFKNGCE